MTHRRKSKTYRAGLKTAGAARCTVRAPSKRPDQRWRAVASVAKRRQRRHHLTCDVSSDVSRIHWLRRRAMRRRAVIVNRNYDELMGHFSTGPGSNFLRSRGRSLEAVERTRSTWRPWPQ